MKAIRLSGLVLVISAIAALLAPVAQADDAAQMYDPSTVYSIDLELPPASLDELKEHPLDEYVQGFLTLAPTAGTPGTEATPLIEDMEVGIRLKGSEGGSFRKLEDGKAAFKIKCNFVSGEKCLGLKKMTLNNMVQDPSMVHETLAYETFRANGVPSPRTGFAYVRVNGEDFGVYLNLETYDDVFLKRQYGDFDDDVQHLYEGEYGDDVVPGGEEDFEVDEGDEGPGEINDLEALIEAVSGESGEAWPTRVELGEMATMWAVEKYIDHWDGYSGHVEPFQAALRPNNYYLYSDLLGRFQMLPWGTDQAWIPTAHVPGRAVTFDGPGGVLFNKCLEDKECFRAYWAGLNLVTHTIPGVDPIGLAESTANLLAPWQAEERTNGRAEPNSDEPGEIEDGVEETLDFAAGRQAEAEEWLAKNKPVEGDPVVDPVSRQPDVAKPPAGPALALARTVRSGRRLITDLQVSAAGQVSLRASFKAGKRRKRACTASKRAQAAGELSIRCRLSRAAMERLAKRPLRLKLRIRIALASGGEQIIVRNVKLARR